MKLSLKQKSFLHYCFIYIVVLSIGIYFRLYPILQFRPEHSSEKATLLVLSKAREKITNWVNAQYPNASKQQKDFYIQKSLKELFHKQGKEVRATIDRISKDIGHHSISQLKNNNRPYLLASDSFYYYSLTQNIKDYGALSDTIKGSKYLNPLMLAPDGHWEPYNLHPFVGYYVYKIVKFFRPNIHLMTAVGYTPFLITAFSLMGFLIVCFFLQCRKSTTCVSSIFFILAPVFIKRSTYGWYDNDPYNALFPLLILSSIFYGIRKIDNQRASNLLACYTAILILLYSFFWQGWVLIFTIIIIASILTLLYIFLIQKDKASFVAVLTHFVVLGALSFLCISVTFGPREFFILFQEGAVALRNFLVPQLSAWPDLYLTVSELHLSSLNHIIQFTGGTIFFVIAVVGVIGSFIEIIKHSQSKRITPLIFLLVYLIVSAIIAKGAQRFVMILFIPLSLMFCLGLEKILSLFELTVKFFPKLKKNTTLAYIGMTTIIFGLTYFPITNIHQSIKSILNPIFNETWEKSLIKIRDNTPQTSIINTWWPPGHFIKAIAQRRVTFDGATINHPQAYWMAKFFLSQDEGHALGILRMLNTSGNKATQFLQQKGFSLSDSVLVIGDITKFDRLKARLYLGSILKSSKDIDQLLNLTHNTPPPSYVLLYEEFVGKNLQLPFIANWNFKAIENINNSPHLLEKVPKRNSEEYITFLWQLAGGPHKFSGKLKQISKVSDIAIFENKLVVNIREKKCEIDSKKYGKGTPYSILYEENDSVIEKKLDGANLPFSVVLVRDNQDQHSAVLLDTSLARSMLIQLYYFDAKGLTFFDSFVDEQDLTKRNVIKVFRIDWNRFGKKFRAEPKKDAFNT